MKKILFMLAIAIATSACSKEGRYTQQSAEIDTYKKMIAAYDARDWATMRTFYADTAKILNNVTKKDAETIDQLIATNQRDAEMFSSWEFDKKESEYEMIVNDRGETWVNLWSEWKGTLKSNGKTYVIPAALTARFVDGKIVREFGYWDLSKLMSDVAQSQSATVSYVPKMVNP